MTVFRSWGRLFGRSITWMQPIVSSMVLLSMAITIFRIMARTEDVHSGPESTAVSEAVFQDMQHKGQGDLPQIYRSTAWFDLHNDPVIKGFGRMGGKQRLDG